MDTVFFTPDQRSGSSGDAMSNDLMTSATRPIKRPLLETNAAANADEINEATEPAAETKGIEGTGAWDAYDVWRRFIKDARDRRKNLPSN